MGRCQVAESLGISDGTLVAWVRAADADEEPGALDADERAELARLRKETHASYTLPYWPRTRSADGLKTWPGECDEGERLRTTSLATVSAMSSPPSVRVLIVDDDALVRSALALMLGGSDDLSLVGEVSDGDEVEEAVRVLDPDVVLMDVRMPRMNGIDALEKIMGKPHPPRVVMLTTFDADDTVLDALAAGADGYMVKDTPPPDLIAAIRAVASGDTMLSPSVARTVVDHVRGTRAGAAPNASSKLDLLTEREREVALAVGRGMSNAEISDELYMSVATVKAHVSRVLDKLGATNRVQVAIQVHDAGLA